MENRLLVGSEFRTERTVMRYVEKSMREWWDEIGAPHDITALSAKRNARPKGWIVEYRATPKAR